MATRTLDAFDIRQEWPDRWGASGTLVVCIDKDIVSEDGVHYPATSNMGGALRSLGFHWESAITVTDGRATTGAISGLVNTDTPQPAHTANYHIYVYDSKGVMRQKLNSVPFHIHESLNDNASTFTWEQWVNANQFTQYRGSSTFIGDYITVAAMISAVLYAKASALIYGLIRLSVPALSASDPIAVGDNDPRVNAEYFVGEYATLAAAVTAIGATPATLVIDSHKTVSANLSIPSTLTLRFTNGAQIQPASGITVTILSPTDGFPKRQIFGGAGTVNFTGSTRASEIYAEWWGANADDATNSTSAFQKAILAGGKQFVNLPGSYVIDETGLAGVSNLTWRGAGKGITRIKLSANSNSNMVLFSGKSNIHLRDLTFDWNNRVAGVGGPAALAFHLSTDFTVRDVGIINFDRFGVALNGCSVARIEDCDIKRASVLSTSNEGILVSAAAGENTDIWLTRNHLVNSGMNLDLNNSFITHNRVKGFGYGSGITMEASPTCHTNVQDGNIASGGVGIDENMTRPGGFENWGARSVMSGNISHNNTGGGFDQGGRFVAFNGNIAYNNNLAAQLGVAGITARYLDASYNALNSTYVGNVSIDTDGAGGKQHYGFVTQNSSVTHQTLAGNMFYPNKTAPQLINALQVSFTGPELEFTVAFDPPELTNGATTETDVTASGAVLGDKVDVTFSLNLQGVKIRAEVTSANNIHVWLENNTGVTVNLGSGTLRFKLRKFADHATY